jgi:hypothetical protein
MYNMSVGRSLFLSHVTLPRFISNASNVFACSSFRSRAEEHILSFDIGILYYDYLLTLPAEVDRFWRPRSHTCASTMFLALRYIALLGHIPLFLPIFADPCAHMVGLICLLSDNLSLFNL